MKRLEVSGAVRPLKWSLGVKGLIKLDIVHSIIREAEVTITH